MKLRRPSVALLSFQLAKAIAAMLTVQSAFAAAVTWNAGTAVSTDGLWSTATNWTADAAPLNGDDLIFAGTDNQANSNDIPLTSLGSLTLNNPGWNLTLGAVTLNGGGLVANGTSSVGGTITLGAAQTWSNLAGLLTFTGTLDAASFALTSDGAGDTTLSNAIANGAALTKSGAGALTLAGTNGFTSATVNGGIITGGTLTLSAGATALTSSASSAVNSNVTIATAAGTITSSAGTLTLGGTLDAGSLALTFDGAGNTSVSNTIANGTTLTKSGAGTLTLTGSNAFTSGTINGGTITGGTVTLSAGATALTSSATSAVNSNVNISTAAGTISSSAGTLTLGGTLDAGSLALTVDGAGDTSVSNAIANGTTLTKSGAGLLTLTGSNAFTSGTITGGTITGGTLTLTGGATAMTSSATSAIYSNITIATAAGTVTSSASTLTLGGTLDAGSLALTFDGAGNISVSNTIANGTTLTKSGAGTLTLSGSSGYTGGTSINGGIVNVTTSSTALGTNTITFNGGARLVVDTGLNVANAITIGTNSSVSGRGLVEAGTTAGTATISGPITINNNAAAGGLFAAPTTGTILHVAGTISSSVPVSSRIGTVMFSGGGTGYSALTNNQGTVMIGANDGIATTATVTLAASAAGSLDLNGFNQSLVGIVKSGANAATIGNSSTATNSTLTTTGTSNFAGVIQDVIGTGSKKVAVTVNGGTLTLSGANTYTGTTTITSGTLQIGAGSTTGALSTSSAIVNNGNLTISRSDTVAQGTIFASVISGTGSVTKAGTNQLTLNGTNTYSGGTIISGGTLVTTADANLGASGVNNGITFNGNSTWNSGSITYPRNLTINNSATLTFNGSNPVISGNVTGTGGVALSNNFGNQVTFSGTSNTFLGVVNISGGGTTGQAYRMQFTSFTDSATANGKITFSASSVTHTDGSVFEYNGSTNLVLANRQFVIASTGSTPLNFHQIRSNGTGTLTISQPLSVTSTTAQTLALKGSNTGANTFGGVIGNGSSTAVSVSKGDAGTWVLSGINTYTGGTTVSAGKLIMTKPSNLGNGALNIGANTFIYAPTSAGALNIGSGVLTQTGGTIGTALGGTASQSAITSTGAAALSGTGVVNVFGITGVAPTAGVNNLITAASGLTGGTYTLGAVMNNSNFTVSGFTRSATAISVTVATATPISTAFWKGGLTGFTNVWAASSVSATSNWTTTAGGAVQGVTPGSTTDVTISATAPTTAPTATVLGANMTIKSLTIADTTNGLGVNGDGFTLTVTPASSSTGITMNASVPASSIGANVELGADQTWTNNSANALTVSGAVSGGFALTKDGTGLVTLSGTNTYSGATTVNAGILNFRSTLAKPAATATTLAAGSIGLGVGAAPSFYTDPNVAALFNTNTLTGYNLVAGSGVAIDTTAGNFTQSTALTAARALTKLGANSLTLSNTNTYSGTTTVAVGGLILGNINAIQNSSAVSVASGTTLQPNVAGTYANTAPVSIVGTGLTGTSNPGALYFGQAGIAAATWNAPLTLGGTTTISSYGVTMDQTLGGAIGGTGPLTINSKGGGVGHLATWKLNAASNYTGNTVILNSDGLTDSTVKLGVDNALPTGTSLNLQAITSMATSVYATLDLNGHSQTLAGLTDTGSSQANTSNTVGKRVINSGALATLTINNSAALTYGTAGTRVLAGTIGGTTAAGAAANNLALTKTGAGDLTLAGANTYTGNTSISNGRIITTAATNLSNGATTLLQSGTGQFFLQTAAVNYSNPLNISTTGFTETADPTATDGAIRMNGNTLSGTITLSGNSRIGAYATSTNTISGQITGSYGIDFYGLNSASSAVETFVISNTANNYTGVTTIINSNYNSTTNSGSTTILKLGASNVIPDGASAGNVAFAVGNTSPGASTVLDLNGFNETINGLTVGVGSGAKITNTAAATSASVLTVGANDTTSSFSGTITDSGAGRTLALTKTGAGTLTLSGLNSFLGNVLVSNGTVIANATETSSAAPLGAADNTRTITVSSGATLQLAQGKALKALFSSSNVPSLIINGTVNDTNLSSPGNNPLGAVTLNNGTLTASAGNSSGYGSYNLNGTVTSTGTSHISSTASVPITLSADTGTTTTFDVQSGTLTVSAALGEVTATGDVRSSGLTKTSAGILILSGTNTYTGGTTVNAGTLTLGSASALGTASATVTGGSLNLGGQTISNAVNVNSGGTLTGSGSIGAATLAGSVTPGGSGSGLITMATASVASTSSIALQLAATGTRGTNYDAITVSGALALRGTITVTLNGLTPAAGQSFDLIDSTGPIDVTNFNVATDLILPALSGGSLVWDRSAFASTGVISIANSDPYATWSGGAGFDVDSNGDGVKNGLAWLLGAADPSANALGLLPTVTQSGGNLTLTFNCLNAVSRGTAVLKVQQSSDLGLTDAWLDAAVPEATSGTPVNGVTFSVSTLDSSRNHVEATISSSEAAGGKLFGRLNAVTTP